MNSVELVAEMNKQLSVPNRMKLADVIAWCISNNLPNTANYFVGYMREPGDHVIVSAAGTWYIDTAVLIAHFTVGDNDKMWKELECDVVTYMGLAA